MSDNRDIKLKRIRTITAAVIALTLISGVGLAVPVSAADIRYTTISTTVTTTVIPDTVRINTTVSALGTADRGALNTASTTSNAVRSALGANKVATKDIATQSITVYPEYSYPTTGTPILSGYHATQSFNITICNATTAGAVVDAIVEAGDDNLQVNGVSPFVLGNNKTTDVARTAVVDKAKAASYAKLFGVK